MWGAELGWKRWEQKCRNYSHPRDRLGYQVGIKFGEYLGCS